MNSLFYKLFYTLQRRIILLIIIILQLVHWAFLFWRLKYISGSISLHYNVYYGLDWFGPVYYLYIYPGLGLILIVINFIFASFFSHKNIKVMVNLLLYLTLFFNVILFTAMIFLVVFYL
ncbi:MAG: hypothetical protein WC860_09455 [Candidatus Margulisiibacteriota bacterium]|jgi:hypothetical protein